MKEKYVKFLTEGLRWVVLAAVSALVQFILNNIAFLELDANFVVILTAVLRFIDAALHKSGIAEKGIVRF